MPYCRVSNCPDFRQYVNSFHCLVDNYGCEHEPNCDAHFRRHGHVPNEHNFVNNAAFNREFHNSPGADPITLDIFQEVNNMPDSLPTVSLEGEEVYIDIELRRKTNCTELFVKAPIIEELMKQLSSGTTEAPASSTLGQGWPVEGVKLYKMVSNICALPGIQTNWWKEYTSPVFHSNMVNVAILRTVGLGEGITFKCNVPFNNNIMNHMRDMLRNQINAILANYTRDASVRLTYTGTGLRIDAGR